ncbi:AMP-binding enzyme [Thermomonospora umbrina]|uniref:AMP-binding enzyme n=2 Tax=Thermomonospora umbrina TaxID=111806 RepID=A0A3D9SGQ7_9ACTN|nr:AMP-binding enzyme [Thermomonospora umbrina]
METVPAAVLDAVARQAARAPGKPALIDGADARALAYGELAALVPAVARGLARRGVRPGDLGGVHLDGARDLALAVYAVAAAGAVPLLLPAAASVDELARLLAAEEARFLFTSAALAGPALAATDRSYVRQVFSFGDVVGATPFTALPAPDRPGDDRPAVDPMRDLALRTPAGGFTHADRLAGIVRWSGSVEPAHTDVLVACATEFGHAAETWMGLIDLALTHGATFVAATGRGGPALLAAAEGHGATIAVTTPATLRSLVHDPTARRSAAGLRLVVIGHMPAEIEHDCRRRHGWSVTRCH